MSDVSRSKRRSQNTATPIYQGSVSEDFVRQILDHLLEGVATLTEDGIVVSWNPPAATLTGYTLPEINAVGLPCIFDTPNEILRLFQEAKVGVPTPVKRLILKCADGRRVPVDVHCSPLRHMGRTQGRVVVVMRDLSDLEALQNRLLQNERLSILGRLAGAVSHDIRNPLGAIFLHADILEDELRRLGGSLPEQLWRSLTAIKEEVTRLHDFVQQYLSLARLSDLPREPVALRDYLEAFSTEMQHYLTDRGIALQLEGDQDLGQVALHQNSFRRVLLNLLNNAVEAMPHGGVLTVRGQRLVNRVCVEITDTGCGIPTEQLPKLFSPLHTTKSEGTGLGLYLVREIVTAHQGEIAVRSDPNVGTTFSLTLPLHPDESRKTRRTKTDGQHSRRGR